MLLHGHESRTAADDDTRPLCAVFMVWTLASCAGRNAKWLEDLTKNILDVTRLESSKVLMKRERFDINDIVKDTIEGFSVHSPANPDMKKVAFLPSGVKLTASPSMRRCSQTFCSASLMCMNS